jgi:hypothetical protein
MNLNRVSPASSPANRRSSLFLTQEKGTIDLYTPKTIKVRHPLRARSKSITLPNFKNVEVKNFPISRLNNYDPILKKKRGSIMSMHSELQSIDEGEND